MSSPPDPDASSRDVADLRLGAMIDPAAAGQRFIAVSGDEVVSMFDIAKALRQRLGLGLG